jgi:hypothetical protein
MPVQSHFFIETIKGYDAQREVFEIGSICFAFKCVADARSCRTIRVPISNQYFGFLCRGITVVNRAGRAVRTADRFQSMMSTRVGDRRINLAVTMASRLRASMVRHERQPSRH